MSSGFKIGFLVYPFCTQLDFAGPAQVFAAAGATQTHLVWHDRRPVMTDANFDILPTHTFDDCPPLDLICVPGGPGQALLMRDPQALDWLRQQGRHAAWVTSVCSGSLVLGAAGLLRGFRAACHWNYRELLQNFGATADDSRVVVDRNRITGAGVTAGIDFALEVVARVWGEREAREVQLLLEYAPQPPFAAGRPEDAGPQITACVRQRLANAREAAEAALS
jgi:cyclohexyl-isocyanide hydratase